jgi:hypothetical protein
VPLSHIVLARPNAAINKELTQSQLAKIKIYLLLTSR